MVQTLALVISLIEVLERSNINFTQIMDKRRQAKAEGRDLTDAELQVFADEADAAIERARNA